MTFRWKRLLADILFMVTAPLWFVPALVMLSVLWCIRFVYEQYLKD